MFTWPPSWWYGPPHLRQHPSRPHISIPSVSQLRLLYSEGSMLLLFTQQAGNQYQKWDIWMPNLTVCSKLGQFMQAGNKDPEGTPIEEDTRQKEKPKRKNGWHWGQMVSQWPCSKKLRGQISWAEEGRVRLQGTPKSLPFSLGFDGRVREWGKWRRTAFKRGGGRIDILQENSMTVQLIPTDTGGKAGSWEVWILFLPQPLAGCVICLPPDPTLHIELILYPFS